MSVIEISERQFQRAYFQWVEVKRQQDWRYELVIHFPSWAGSAKFASIMAKDGAPKGFPDNLILYPIKRAGQFYPGCFLEFKSKSGRVSEDQSRWLELLKQAGYVATVVWDLESAIHITEEWFA